MGRQEASVPPSPELMLCPKMEHVFSLTINSLQAFIPAFDVFFIHLIVLYFYAVVVNVK